MPDLAATERLNARAPQRRPVRSFVRREGRITDSQKKALAALWPTYGIEYSPHLLNFDTLFTKPAPVVLEIGFGNGDSLVQMAKQDPDKNYLGVEVYSAGVGHCMIAAKEQAVDNLRLISHDAIDILKHQTSDHSLHAVQLFFPDPWPKKRHHKRRIMQTSFITLLQQKLRKDGVFHFATDWQPYANWAIEMLEATPEFDNLAGPGNFAPRPAARPITKFEKRGTRLGHGVWDLLFINQRGAP